MDQEVVRGACIGTGESERVSDVKRNLGRLGGWAFVERRECCNDSLKGWKEGLSSGKLYFDLL